MRFDFSRTITLFFQINSDPGPAWTNVGIINYQLIFTHFHNTGSPFDGEIRQDEFKIGSNFCGYDLSLIARYGRGADQSTS